MTSCSNSTDALMPLTTTAMPNTIATIRLTEEQQLGIRRAVERACQETGTAWKRVMLFGSRVNPEQKGGDIDLLIELPAEPSTDTYVLNRHLRIALEDELGERKIDLVIDDGHTHNPFITIARQHAVTLAEAEHTSP